MNELTLPNIFERFFPTFPHSLEKTYNLLNSINNFDDIEKAIGEMERVGKDRFVITVLKKSRKKELIEELIKSLFDVKNAVEEDKDIIYFCRKKK